MYISIYTYARESMTKEPDWPQHDPSTSMLSPNSILPTLRLIALSFRKKEFGARVENVHTHTHTHTHTHIYIYIYAHFLHARRILSCGMKARSDEVLEECIYIYIYICVCVCVCIRILGAFAKLRKATISFVTGRIFMKFGI